MSSPPDRFLPPNEKERLQALYESEILNTNKNDSDYDRYTALCVRLFDVKASNIVLVGDDTIFVKSIAPQHNDLVNYPRTPSVLEQFLFPDSPDVVLIPDMLAYKSHNIVIQKKLGIRFLAGAALTIDDMKIGFLSISDDQPRCASSFDLKQQMNLLDIAASISSLISERRRSIMNIKKANSLRLLSPSIKPTFNENDDVLLLPCKSSSILRNCWKCQFEDYMRMAKDILSKMTETKDVSWMFNQLYYLDYKGCLRTTYANAIYAIMVSTACYVRSLSDHVEIRVGFKKSHSYRNHISLSPSSPKPSIVDGKMKIEVHFTKMVDDEILSVSHPTIAKHDAVSFDSLVHEALNGHDEIPSTYYEAFASHFHDIDNLLRDINGSSRYSELLETPVSFRSFGSSLSYKTPQGEIPHHKIRKCVYDYSIPCVLHL